MSYFVDGTTDRYLRLDLTGFPWFGYNDTGNGLIDTNDRYALMGWFYIEAHEGTDVVFLQTGELTNDANSASLKTGGVGFDKLSIYNGTDNDDSAVTIPTGEWVHLAFLGDWARSTAGAKVTGWINGSMVHEHPSSTTGHALQCLKLGGNGDANFSMNGYVAEVKYFFLYDIETCFPGGEETIRDEMFHDGPRYFPERCLYFPLNGIYRTSDVQRRGLRFDTNPEAAGDMEFSSFSPPNLLPASFFQRQMMQHNPPPDADTVFARRLSLVKSWGP